MRVALVTSERMPQDNWHDADSALLAAELARLGVAVGTPAWENGDGWADYDVLVLQSPWSMWRKLAEFDQWLAEREAGGSRMLNPPDVLRIGSSKRYLTTLAEAGVVTVPTTIIGPDAREQILCAYPGKSASRRTVVIKPLSSGGALDTREFTAERLEEAVAHAAYLIDSGAGALVQPYVEAIDTHRELGILTLRGELSHAITKRAILRPGSDEREFHPDPLPHQLTAAQAAVAERAYQAFLGLRPDGAAPLLSVRLDFLIDPETEPGLLLLEVEAVAPVKFFTLHRERAAAFARAVADLAR
ncbi:hypothetical protein ACQP2E_21330 [Actinoplanes sp. CA-015351]|uniref:hypothetical protein n=1 Tax=Actinoplanes sp. CA-015351 TaxID=3239897 RepID=UPI003D963F35